MLEFVSDTHYICGVDVGVYRTSYALTDLLGNVVALRQSTQPLDEYQVTLERLTREIPAFLKEAGIPREKMLCERRSKYLEV